MGEEVRKSWLTDLKPPSLERRLDIIEALDPEIRDRIDAEGVRRTVRAFNPRPKERRACYVCGRHRTIAQWHHLIEVGDVAKVLRALAIYDWAPSLPAVPLCPNHHGYEHVIRRGKKRASSELSDALNQELSDREWDRLIEIDDTRAEAHERIWRQIREEFLRREAAYQGT